MDYHGIMSTPQNKTWTYLAPKPKSNYRQLYVKGRGIRARVLYGRFMSDDEPMTPEEIAEDYNLPVEAVLEAIAYCQSDPPEIRQDWEMEEASIRERGKSFPKPTDMPPSEAPMSQEKTKIDA